MGLGSGGFLCIAHGSRKYCARVVFSFSLCASEVIKLRSWMFILGSRCCLSRSTPTSQREGTECWNTFSRRRTACACTSTEAGNQHLDSFMQQAAQHRASVLLCSTPPKPAAWMMRAQRSIAEAQETSHEPILINAPPVRVGCPYGTYIRAPCQVPCQVPDPADAASSGHAGPGQPVSQMFALSCPISMIHSHLSLSRTRTLGSGAHSLLGCNPTLRPLEQTWAPDLQRSKLERARQD